MQTIHPGKCGLALGALLAGVHLLWALLVASGGAQALVDFILRLHFIKLALAIAPFDLGNAVLLVAMTGAVGFAIGAVVGLVWNRLA